MRYVLGVCERDKDVCLPFWTRDLLACVNRRLANANVSLAA